MVPIASEAERRQLSCGDPAAWPLFHLGLPQRQPLLRISTLPFPRGARPEKIGCCNRLLQEQGMEGGEMAPPLDLPKLPVSPQLLLVTAIGPLLEHPAGKAAPEP